MKPPSDREMLRLAMDDELRNAAECLERIVIHHGLRSVHVCEGRTPGQCITRDKRGLYITPQRNSGYLWIRDAGLRDRTFDCGYIDAPKNISPRTLVRFANILVQLQRR